MNKKASDWLWRQQAAKTLYSRTGVKWSWSDCWNYAGELQAIYRTKGPVLAVHEDMSYWKDGNHDQ